ncbi:unnamed protein product [Lactuca saligna]|uniref:Uncharacterized protein n=1 Tax=Lactuca saligna TaxID=75948 RepID=A0AA35Z8K0_LACSI|nr:unnamed protein product [Lactuca saligna]
MLFFFSTFSIYLVHGFHRNLKEWEWQIPSVANLVNKIDSIKFPQNLTTGSNSYESMTLFVYFHKYPSVPKTCAYLLSSRNVGISILHFESIKKKDVEYCMENAFSTYLVCLGNATMCGLWWVELEMYKTSGQYKEVTEERLKEVIYSTHYTATRKRFRNQIKYLCYGGKRKEKKSHPRIKVYTISSNESQIRMLYHFQNLLFRFDVAKKHNIQLKELMNAYSDNSPDEVMPNLTGSVADGRDDIISLFVSHIFRTYHSDSVSILYFNIYQMYCWQLFLRLCAFSPCLAVRFLAFPASISERVQIKEKQKEVNRNGQHFGRLLNTEDVDENLYGGEKEKKLPLRIKVYTFSSIESQRRLLGDLPSWKRYAGNDGMNILHVELNKQKMLNIA